MFRRNSLGVSILAFGIFLSAGATVFADETRKLSLPDNVVLQGTRLEAGEYTITWFHHSPELTVTVSRGKKVRVTASALMVECNKAHDRDTIVVNSKEDGTRALQAIVFAGSSQAIVFDKNAPRKNETQFILHGSSNSNRRTGGMVR